MKNNSQTSSLLIAGSFLSGFAVASLLRLVDSRKLEKDNKVNAGAGPIGDDFSMFWGNINELTKLTEQRKFLPKEFYGKMVQDCVICCVDCLIVRQNSLTKQRECLLVERSTEPVQGVWWFPGGRMFKGETFFSCAIRKAREETGLTDVRPIQVLGFYNTFFPTSAWDSEDKKGTQTVNPIILVEIQESKDILLDRTSERYRWISLDPALAENNGEDKYVVGALLRLQAWISMYGEVAWK